MSGARCKLCILAMTDIGSSEIYPHTKSGFFSPGPQCVARREFPNQASHLVPIEAVKI
jgi:hypothetical protein